MPTPYPPDLEKCRPLRTSPPPKGTFEIGLVLAGAVSAGAYTGGVMDFLFEALDSWYAAKNEQKKENDRTKWTVPTHDVSLRAISGTSAGGITGALAGAALKYDFPHVRGGLSRDEKRKNPFYRPWVTEIDMQDFLQDQDTKENPRKLRSVLDSTKLLSLAKDGLSYSGKEANRQYLANPLKLLLTQGNLRGVPYAMNMKGNTAAGHEMSAHADHLRFAVQGLNDTAPSVVCTDESVLTFPNSMAYQGWMDLAIAALGTSAFPLFLRPRVLSRTRAQYDNRFVALPGDEDPLFAQILPNWPETVADPYSFLGVDGGVMNNEPLDLCRVELAGLLGRNPRDGTKANRAVVMVDPFPDPSELGPAEEVPLLKALLALTMAWKNQARFKPVDLALADHSTVYSRFLIAPSRGKEPGPSEGFALAGGALGGFSGFLAEMYRDHDYLLGRRNCQHFLREHFTLPASNPLFDDWPPHLKTDKKFVTRNDAGQDELPIIPLVGACTNEEPLPTWPNGAFKEDDFRKGVERRVNIVYNGLLDDLNVPWYARAYLWLGWQLKKGSLIDDIVSMVTKALKERGL